MKLISSSVPISDEIIADGSADPVDFAERFRVAIERSREAAHGLDWVHSRRYVDALMQDECGGVAASWCPIHGACTCPLNDGEYEQDINPICPLHAVASRHAETL